MRVSEIMTSAVIVTLPEKTILEAVSLMIEHRISGLPVVNTLGEPVGVVTEGDLLRRAELGTEKQRSRWVRFFSSLGSEASEYTLTHARRVAEVMTTNPIAVSPSSPLEKVVTLMEIHNVRQILVVDDGKLVGLVTRGSFMEPLKRFLIGRTSATDAEIGRQILAELEAQEWTRGATIKLAVNQGIVELDGTITDERLRVGLRTIAENVPGVLGVRDNIAFIEPMAGLMISGPGA